LINNEIYREYYNKNKELIALKQKEYKDKKKQEKMEGVEPLI
jgi:hypothetical protein